ncbi:NADP-dependent phosphogluconate dehydrogenase [Corynebacterium pseudodiphtheriticum]|uniref:NADP-dependent phosphogluconate dehydrogenase n=1 Tax=Corynebacterium pseudodiphtheriticum TaxID=37637 RepID=UPI0025515822|nr:NADP-dependent phosphogluconate dehydrogenase [Corynebacterium pseudodiphtheriticum]MDK8584619.1 NADP-dependent phosphogluconate dehydrogenase [Corynebacterium pseudodiphtheriticum]MDK8840370.1 NADP-dependent phosphogluconate dehydrogenase [Corynebacterium pseudodiphtheriticum]
MNNQQPSQQLADIAIVGVGVMGSSLARNFARNGYRVALYDQRAENVSKLIAEHGGEGEFVGCNDLQELAVNLSKPRRALLMVPAGTATDAAIDDLVKAFDEGDILIDGGNSLYTDTVRRERAVALTGRHFVGAGISGGEEGALTGPSIMPGGPQESWESIRPLLESIAAKVDGAPCVRYIGANGAGHFVKMVHNGIEYADMQLIGEAYHLLRHGAGLEPSRIAKIFRDWNDGDLDSYLIGITADILETSDPDTGAPMIDVIHDAAGQKGTGRWTAKEALDLGIPATAIGEAVFARALSSSTELRAAALDHFPTGNLADFATLGVSVEEFIEHVRRALYASKLVAYAQGFDLIAAGSAEYNWNINPRDLAAVWRGGCIIQAAFLDRIDNAYEKLPELPSLLLDSYFTEELDGLIDSWRTVAASAIRLGLAAPVFSSSLSYYDSLCSKRLPAALVQAQRDYFGAHTYRRVDTDGVFHLDWTGDKSQEQKR